MAADGGHVDIGTGSKVESDKATGSGKQEDDLQRKIDELMEENGELVEEVEMLAKEVCRLRREKDLSLKEEERLNLEVAFLEEEKEYYQNQVEERRKLIFELKDELEKAVAETTRYKSHLVLSELDRCEEIDDYLEEIAQLIDDKSHVARMINYGRPLKIGNLRHSLVRTEEYLAQKADYKRLLSELNTASAKILSQDSYILDLERSVHELAEMLCRFHPMPVPSSLLAAAAAAAGGGGALVSAAVADCCFHLCDQIQNMPTSRRRLIRRQDMTPFNGE